MSQFGAIKKAKTADDLAQALGYSTRNLLYIAYGIKDDERYQGFSLPKKSGGERIILAPHPKLKALQNAIAKVFTEGLEIEEPPHYYYFPKASHGFRPKKSIATNASQHTNRRYVINIDLMDFFGSIHFGRVRGALMKDSRFMLDQKVATILAQIACHNNSLPQGSPCSPILSNIVARTLDMRMLQFAKQYRLRYTRYVDDITLSTNQKIIPAEIAHPIEGSLNIWATGFALQALITNAGYRINSKKTRVQIEGSQQTVTGLTVNEKVNISRIYYRNLRAMCHSLYRTGVYHHKGSTMSDINVLHGLFSHLNMVRKFSANKTSRKKFWNPKPKSAPDCAEPGFGIERLYADFTFYKNTIANDRPLVVVEGWTDIVYLKYAVRSYAEEFPNLCATTDHNKRVILHFMADGKHESNMLGFEDGGTGNLKNFINNYQQRVKSSFTFKERLITFKKPVIIVIDNDKGADPIFSLLNPNKQNNEHTRKKIDIDKNTTFDFYHIGGAWKHVENLYLVKTPEIGVDGTSKIEVFFRS